jgi:hypothetical protein
MWIGGTETIARSWEGGSSEGQRCGVCAAVANFTGWVAAVDELGWNPTFGKIKLGYELASHCYGTITSIGEEGIRAARTK